MAYALIALVSIAATVVLLPGGNSAPQSKGEHEHTVVKRQSEYDDRGDRPDWGSDNRNSDRNNTRGGGRGRNRGSGNRGGGISSCFSGRNQTSRNRQTENRRVERPSRMTDATSENLETTSSVIIARQSSTDMDMATGRKIENRSEGMQQTTQVVTNPPPDTGTEEI